MLPRKSAAVVVVLLFVVVVVTALAGPSTRSHTRRQLRTSAAGVDVATHPRLAPVPSPVQLHVSRHPKPHADTPPVVWQSESGSPGQSEALFTTPRRPLFLAAILSTLSLGAALLSRPPAAQAAVTRPFQSIQGLFYQESGSPRPRVVYSNFGAKVDWPQIHAEALQPNRKLIFFLRHAEGFHNSASREFRVRNLELARSTSFCSWRGDNDLFDSVLDPIGIEQTGDLNALLKAESGYQTIMPAGQPVRVLTSPLRRCLQTFLYSFEGLEYMRPDASELCRETIGVNPAEARHRISDPPPGSTTSPCPYTVGLRTLFGDKVNMDIVDTDLQLPVPSSQYPEFLKHGAPIGVFSDEDPVWEGNAFPSFLVESREAMIMRANLLLATIFDHVPESVVVVSTHSLFMTILTEVVGQRAYFPLNCELLPLVIEDCRSKAQAA